MFRDKFIYKSLSLSIYIYIYIYITHSYQPRLGYLIYIYIYIYISEWGIPRTGYLIPARDTPLALARLGELLGNRRRGRHLVPIVPICLSLWHNNTPKFKKSRLSGEKKPLRAVTRQTKLIYDTRQYSTIQYTLHDTIIQYNTIIPLYNVYTLGYPDGFIQCIYSWIPWWF